MENKDKIERITEMEEILDKSADIFADVNKALDELENNMKRYNKLDKYYSSENWFIDEVAYNLFIENNNIAIRMLEIATKMLKRD